MSSTAEKKEIFSSILIFSGIVPIINKDSKKNLTRGENDMLTSSNGVLPVSLPKSSYTALQHTAAPKTVAAPSYDSVSFSSAANRETDYQRNLVGRLSLEVRAATTTGDIQALRKAVASGEYKPDPGEIARKMLFWAGV